MADGVSGTALYHAILDPSPQPRAPVPDEWRPVAGPSGPALTVVAVRDLALNPLPNSVRPPGCSATPPRP